MKKIIESIVGVIPFTENAIEIPLNRRNLIITGGNGSGKTSLLHAIYTKLETLLRDKPMVQLPDSLMAWEAAARQLPNLVPGTMEYVRTEQRIGELKLKIDRVQGYPRISLAADSDVYKGFHDGSFALTYFHANRQAAISSANSASGLGYSASQLSTKNDKVGAELEQHLVNLVARKSFAESPTHYDPELVEKISSWLTKFELNLKFLFESDSISLSFDLDEFKFYILQDGRSPFTFQQLSSGYSAILYILSALLMRASYLKIDPWLLCGIVLIDEIDAHLHVSLQKKIFPFLVQMFPGLQFLVTTHSPFVLTSVNDALIYDLSKREAVEDVSAHSYEAILQGIFGVGQSSMYLQERVVRLAALLDADEFDSESVGEILDDLTGNLQYLDEESKFYFYLAERRFLLSNADV